MAAACAERLADLIASARFWDIDRLHARAGTRELVEIHGSIENSSCRSCGRSYPLSEVTVRLEANPEGVPRRDCGAPLKPGVVLFGECLPVAAVTIVTRGATRYDRRAALRCGGDVVSELGVVLQRLGLAG